MRREKWTAISSGVGIGRIWRIEDINLDISKRTTDDIEGELAKFRGAVASFNNRTESIAEHLYNMNCERKVDLVRLQELMMNDESLCPEIENRIKKGISAEFAVSEICDKYIEEFASSENSELHERSIDINDVKRRLLGILLGVKDATIYGVDSGTVLAAKEFSAEMLSKIIPGSVSGLVAEKGGKNSHAAILARSMSLPAVFNIPHLMERIHDGEIIFIDGSTGEIILGSAEQRHEEARA
ncbi:phosphoenolpyruvate-utilizing N-terminal domain-containing protein [Lachnospiraceae bacterium C1.1]|nr:PEP-utilizing enzyme [Lachnospiraceae bacterium C1.1]